MARSIRHAPWHWPHRDLFQRHSRGHSPTRRRVGGLRTENKNMDAVGQVGNAARVEVQLWRRRQHTARRFGEWRYPAAVLFERDWSQIVFLHRGARAV